jgi:hypothetical protein
LAEIATPRDLLAMLEISDCGVNSGRVGALQIAFEILGCGVAVARRDDFPIGEKRTEKEGRKNERNKNSSHRVIRVADTSAK